MITLRYSDDTTCVVRLRTSAQGKIKAVYFPCHPEISFKSLIAMSHAYTACFCVKVAWILKTGQIMFARPAEDNPEWLAITRATSFYARRRLRRKNADADLS